MSQLTDIQLATLVRLLDAHERSLLSVVREQVAQLRDSGSPEASTPAGDPADQAETELVRQHEGAILQRHVRELRDIEGALQRLAGSQAGVCIDCGYEIGFERLLAQPTASRCVACQAVYEQTHQPVLDLVG